MIFNVAISKYILQSFLIKLAVFGYLPKSKKNIELAPDAYFLHNFSVKNLLMYYSINWPSLNIRP